MHVTLDASVWLSALSTHEPEHARCTSLLDSLVAQRTPLHQPGLFVIEICAAIARRTGDRALAMEAAAAVLEMPNLQLYELTHELAAQAADIAARCSLRGADAVYVATAREAGAILITLDREMLERAADVLHVVTPQQWGTVS